MTAVAPTGLTRLSTWVDEVADPLLLAEGTVFTFTDPDCAYVLLEGHLDLFAAIIADGAPSGRWRGLCQIEAGTVIPTAPGGPAHRLVARVGAGARLARLSLDELRTYWASKTDRADQLGRIADRLSREEFSCALDRTLAILSSSLRESLPPREFTAVESGATAVPAGTAARSVKDAAWLRVDSGCVRYGELIEGQFTVGSVLFVPRNDWLFTSVGATLSPCSTAELLYQGSLWPIVSAHMSHFLGGMDVRAARDDATEADELRKSGENSRGEFERIAAGINQVFVDDAAKLRLSDVHDDEAILGAVRLVGQHSDLDVKTPLAGLGEGSDLRKLARIMRASKAHSREVVLGQEWYRQDIGHLVGFCADSKTPVALLRQGGSYYIVDSTGREPVMEVSRKTVHAVTSRAYQCYPPLPPRVNSAGRLLRYGLAGNRADLLRTVLLAVVAGVLGLSVPVMTGQVLGTYVTESDRSLVVSGAFLVMAAAVITAALNVVVNLSMLRVTGRATARMQTAVWTKVLSLPVSFFERETTGAMATKVLGVHRSQELVTGPLTVATLGLFSGLMNLFVIIYYSPRLAPVAVALVGVALLTCWFVARRALGEQKQVYTTERRLSSLVLQLLTSMPKLRVSATEERALRVWSGLELQYTKHKMALRRIQNRLVTFNFGYPLVCTVLLFALVGGWWSSAVPTTAFLIVYSAFNLLIASVLQFTSAIIVALAAVPMLSELQPILREPPESSSGTVDPGELSGRFAMERVSFRYGDDGPLVLDNVSFTAEAGQFIAIVGPSGSGKSTILRMLLGFERPVSGSVLFDSLDLSELDVQAVRSQCGVVLQGGGLSPGNIRSNILGTSGLTLQDAWEAAEMAGLKDEIKAMPMGMATVISEGASAISGGQQQRLMIARALISRPRMVCFDEATSALDNPTQRIVAESTRRLNATRVVIAHRLSTVADADLIVVLDRGHVVQQGGYEELLTDREGLFARLARRQMS